ncbi:MAG: glycosyltransferase [Flavobacteriia bacterium]|nr:glycosyltransferase [Flavobacteriia bacterium]
MYNASQTIVETVNSVCKQSYTEIEIIIIDDASTDNSLELLSQFKKPKIQIIQNKNNKGASFCRNLGLKNSKGAFIQFVDSDDILHRDKILNQINSIDLTDKNVLDSSILSSHFYYFDKTISDKKSSKYENNFRDYMPLEWLIAANYDKVMFPPIAWLIPKNIIEKAGFWDESISYNDDTEFFCRVLLNANKIVHVPESICFYRTNNPNSYGSQRTKKAILSEWKVNTCLVRHLLNAKNDDSIRKSLAYRISKFYYSIYPEHHEIHKEIENLLKDLNVEYPKIFGNGFFSKLAKLIGWKITKRLHKLYK